LDFGTQDHASGRLRGVDVLADENIGYTHQSTVRSVILEHNHEKN